MVLTDGIHALCIFHLVTQPLSKLSEMALRANKEFMIQAMKQDVSLFSCASTDLERDFDLALIAFAADDLDVIERTFAFQSNFSVSFLRQVQAVSTLTVLNQGTETVLVYKQLIADFPGVPTGNMDLPLLGRAYSNMTALQALEEDGQRVSLDTLLKRRGDFEH